MAHRFVLPSVALLLTACSGGSPPSNDVASAESTGALGAGARRDADRVFVLSNEARNAVIVFDAPDDGSLREIGRVETGGRGSDDGLGSQGALALSGDGRWLVAVNAASNDVSLFRVHSNGHVELADVAASGGDRPISVTESRGLVYVLNAGVTQNVSGFVVDTESGALRPIAGSARALSEQTSVGAAQVALSPDGDALVVSEKATNRIDTFVVRRDGTLTDGHVTPSAGMTPFGFAFDPSGTLIVSDAAGGAPGAGAMSSYRLDHGAMAALVTGPVADHQAAPCWVVVTRDGRFAYTSNTASGTVSGYNIASTGAIAAFADGGATASTGAGTKPADMTLDDEGKLLYVLEGGTHAIGAYRIAQDGTLAPAGHVDDLPVHAVGLVANVRH